MLATYQQTLTELADKHSIARVQIRCAVTYVKLLLQCVPCRCGFREMGVVTPPPLPIPASVLVWCSQYPLPKHRMGERVSCQPYTLICTTTTRFLQANEISRNLISANTRVKGTLFNWHSHGCIMNIISCRATSACGIVVTFREYKSRDRADTPVRCLGKGLWLRQTISVPA